MWTTLPIILNDGGDAATAQTALPARTLVAVSVDANQVTFKSKVALAAGIDQASGGNVVANFFANDNTTVLDADSVAGGTSEISAITNASNTFTITTVGVPDGEYIITAQTVFKLDDADDAALIVAMAAGSTQKVTVTTNAMVLTSQNAFDATIDKIDATTVLTFTSTTEGVIRNATTNSYVVDSGVTSAATSEILELLTDSATSRSVNVTAFMDVNVNGILDSTEYASPTRTVTWTKPSEIVATTTMSPVVGDAALSAVVTTTPVLNGQQLLANDTDFINAKFTRTLSANTVYADDDDTSNGTATTTSIWNDTAKTFTVAATLDADAASEASNATGTTVADSWGTLAAPTAGGTILDSIQISTTGLVSAVTTADHVMVNGDKITMAIDSDTAVAFKALAAETARPVNVTGARTFTYQVSETTGLPTTATAVLPDIDQDDYVVVTYNGNTGLVDRVGAETYTAQATVLAVLQGNIVTTGVVAATAATTTISTVGTATVQGSSRAVVGTAVTAVAAGTLSVPVTVTVTDSAGVAVGAGRAVAFALSASGTTNTFKVNAKTADTVYTDANGQATATITASTGVNLAAVQVTATAENLAVADIDLQWQTVAYGLIDLSGTEGTLGAGTIARDIIKLSSYSANLMVADQWFNKAPAATYRLKVTGEGVSGSYVTLVDGKATVTMTDSGAYGTSMITAIDLEKLTGTTWAATGTYNFTANLSTAHTLSVGAAGTTLYGNTVVASVAVAAKALVEIDQRTSTVATPAYVTNLVLNGKLAEKTTLAAKAGAVVTVSGPNNILFSEDKVAARGSLTFHTSATGLFEVKAYSTTAQTNTVITFTSSDGTTGTIKVSFTGTGVGEGTSLVITAPAAVKPATTFQVSAKLQDAYGNPVDTATGRVKVTYTGSGIVWGTLPTETDSTGSLSFAVLLGSNDSASAVVTVSYDQNGDGDYVDAKDLTTTSTTEINAAGVASSGATVVNVGSFNGKLVVYANKAAGAKISYKIAGKWVVQNPTSNTLQRFDRVVAAKGVTVKVDIYVDGVKKLSKSVVTK